jgi:hypothetical protein
MPDPKPGTPNTASKTGKPELPSNENKSAQNPSTQIS